MTEELNLKKCLNCGAIVKVMNNCNCNFFCCGQEMKEIKANSTDAAFEKHVPTYEKKNHKLYVTVNHVMEEEHFIEWRCLCTDEREEYIKLDYTKDAKVVFEDVCRGTLYAYCNKHGLWKTEIK